MLTSRPLARLDDHYEDKISLYLFHLPPLAPVLVEDWEAGAPSPLSKLRRDKANSIKSKLLAHATVVCPYHVALCTQS